jgi:uncharacterized phiE125 gp8 family phage protein
VLVVRRLSLVTAPAVEPLGLDEAKRAVRRYDGDEDTDLEELIKEARDYFEGATSRQLISATYDLILSGVPCEGWIEVPRPPLQTVSFFKYYDTAGTLQTLAPTVYGYTAPQGPQSEHGRIFLKPEQYWPTIQDRQDAIQIRFVAGYGDEGTAVPYAVKRGLKLLIGHWYANGEGVVKGSIAEELPLGVRSVIAKYKRRDEQRVA